MIKVAGFLHDLGKLAIPNRILEKPGKLTKQEFNTIKAHTFYTYRTLAPITELDIINKWGSFHHERLDGNGYPFHLIEDDLPLGSRIMAVADVFTAITEDRPYRKGMVNDEVIRILRNMAGNMALDPTIVDLLEKNYEEINQYRITSQKASLEEYQKFLQPLD